MQNIKDSDIEGRPNECPAGFSLIRGPNNKSVLVPTFLVPATKLALQVDSTREELDTYIATPGVSVDKHQQISCLTKIIFSRGSLQMFLIRK
jgi:hypothetical protein